MNPNRKPVEPETTRSAKIVEVIETVSIRGNGVETPVREIIQYWSKEGILLAEQDPCNGVDGRGTTFGVIYFIKNTGTALVKNGGVGTVENAVNSIEPKSDVLRSGELGKVSNVFEWSVLRKWKPGIHERTVYGLCNNLQNVRKKRCGNIHTERKISPISSYGKGLGKNSDITMKGEKIVFHKIMDRCGDIILGLVSLIIVSILLFLLLKVWQMFFLYLGTKVGRKEGEKMTKKYYYFVSFSHNRGFGNGEYILEQKIEGMDILNDLARYIEDQNNIQRKTIVILNFTLLRVEENEN